MKKSSFLKVVLMCGALTACDTLNIFDDTSKSTLDGDRLSLFDFEKSLQQDPDTQFGMEGDDAIQQLSALPEILKGQTDQSISLVAPWVNKFWPQVGGYPNHAMKHIAFNNDEPSRAWRSSIGSGSSTRLPLTAPPIMADGMVFTLNNDAEIYAFDIENGKRLWRKNVKKDGEDEVVLGGGVAYSGNRLYVTAGFNEVLALNPKTGDILWRTDTKSPIRAAPSAIPGRLFVTTLDNQTIAMDGQTGQQLWSHRGLNSAAGVLGASTPAVTRDAVFTTYSSGEVYALQIDTGLELWVQNLSPLARVAGRTMMTDIRALPVFDGGVVYATSLSNRMSAINARTGENLWQIPVGSATTPWVSGNRIFMVETGGTLISLNRNDGQVLWQHPLPRFEDADDREGLISWQGPLLAGGRLMIFGSNGDVQSHSVLNGDLISQWRAGGDIKLAPAMADETLYLLDDDGDLTAWR